MNSWFECVWLLACHKQAGRDAFLPELHGITLQPFTQEDKEYFRARAKEIFPHDTLGRYGLVEGQLKPTDGVKILFQKRA